KKLDALIVQATFKQGEQLAAAGDHAGAAKAYLRAAKEFPGDPRAAQACVNAETEAQRANDVTTLREASQLLTRGEFQAKPEAPLGAWTAANAFQSLGLYSDAAVMHESIAENRERPAYQKFEHTKDAAFNAVILRTTLGDYTKAIENGNRYLSAYGTSAEADDVAFYMGRAHSRAGRPADAIALYKRYVGRAKSADQKARAYVELALLQIQTHDDKGAERSLEAAVTLGKRHKGELGPEGKYAAAHARYMQGEQVLADFEKIQIEGDVKQLSKRLKQKAELLKKAASIFLDTVSLGVAEWTTAALYQIGFTYESFSKALRDAPAPSGLSENDKEAYQAQIDEFVVPIEEKSLDAYESGWKKAVELGIYNQWTAKMREALGRLNSELYPPLKEAGLEIRSGDKQRLPALYEAPKTAPAKVPSQTAPATKPAPAPAAKKGAK
ncbi:tetratricopeptide repeat protein, partial [bacterium]